MLNLVSKSLKELPTFQKVIVGCSGGVDSVVLAHVLKELGYQVVLAHLNHQLRSEASDADETFVRRLAGKWEMELETKKVNIPQKGNLENSARQVRYAFLESVRQKYQADFIVTAHHQDDQLETILMHAMRGAGLRGLRGMQVKSDHLLRPLLSVSKKQILHYAKKHDLNYRVDASNLNLSLARNRWRHLGVPYLKNHIPNFKSNLLKVSQSAKKKLSKLSGQAQEWLSTFLTEDHFNSEHFLKLPSDLQEEVLIQLLGSVDLYQNEIQKMLTLIQKNRSGSKVLIKHRSISISHGQVYLNATKEDRKVLDRKEIKQNETCYWGTWRLKNVSNQRLFVRPWEKGDRFNPSGMAGSKKLQDFFVDQKIPQHQRGQIPVIVDEKNVIMAVAQYRVAEHATHLKTKLIIHNTL